MHGGHQIVANLNLFYFVLFEDIRGFYLCHNYGLLFYLIDVILETLFKKGSNIRRRTC